MSGFAWFRLPALSSDLLHGCIAEGLNDTRTTIVRTIGWRGTAARVARNQNRDEREMVHLLQLHRDVTADLKVGMLSCDRSPAPIALSEVPRRWVNVLIGDPNGAGCFGCRRNQNQLFVA